MGERMARVNAWLSSRAWVWIAGLTIAVVLLGACLGVTINRLTAVTDRANENTTRLSELRYRSCIEDEVLNFKIAEGAAVEALVSGNRSALSGLLPAYHDALELLRGAQAACHAKFPE